MTTRRYPRTLQEAFGPYTSNDLDVHVEPSSLARAIYIGISLAAILGFALVALGN